MTFDPVGVARSTPTPSRIHKEMIEADEIRIRDPFVLPDEAAGVYYLFGSADGGGRASGFSCYRSHDLLEWEGPFPAFQPSPSFWGKEDFWAPEVHRFGGRFYMFASFKAARRYRGTHVLVSDIASGPYTPLVEGPITPPDWQCLDGTLHVDSDGNPWIVFCHEWVQVHNGAMYAMRLSPDLREASGRPVFLFTASEGPWVRKAEWPADNYDRRFPDYVTDGPFLYRLANGLLIMLWSSIGAGGYAMGTARSDTGNIEGPWRQDAEPLWTEDGGHGMIFRAFDGRLMLAFHSPNNSPQERPVFVEIEEADDSIRLKT